VQEYSHEHGWQGVTEPFETNCQAVQAMQALPKNGVTRRTYSALAPRE
jgi:hypothetical protein